MIVFVTTFRKDGATYGGAVLAKSLEHAIMLVTACPRGNEPVGPGLGFEVVDGPLGTTIEDTPDGPLSTRFNQEYIDSLPGSVAQEAGAPRLDPAPLDPMAIAQQALLATLAATIYSSRSRLYSLERSVSDARKIMDLCKGTGT